MKQYRLNIDGKEVLGVPGQTILEVARENDISIPTLCYDERTTIYGACGLCVVEVEGNPKLVKACATEIAPNMVVRTKTKRVLESRKTNLELLLSNHVGDCHPPACSTARRAPTAQGYVGLIANGRFEEAIALIRERIPLPAPSAGCAPIPARTTAAGPWWTSRWPLPGSSALPPTGISPGRIPSCPRSPRRPEDPWPSSAAALTACRPPISCARWGMP